MTKHSWGTVAKFSGLAVIIGGALVGYGIMLDQTSGAVSFAVDNRSMPTRVDRLESDILKLADADVIEAKFNGVERQLSNVETDVRDVKQEVEQIQEDVQAIEKSVITIEVKQDAIQDGQEEILEAIGDLAEDRRANNPPTEWRSTP